MDIIRLCNLLAYKLVPVSYFRLRPEYMLTSFPRSTSLPFDLRVATRVDQRQRTFKHESRTSLYFGLNSRLLFPTPRPTSPIWHLTLFSDNDESDRVWLDRTPLMLRPQSRIYEPIPHKRNHHRAHLHRFLSALSGMTGDGVVLPNICGGLGGHWFHYGR